MLTAYDNYNGIACRLYRTPTEIERDISLISGKIKDTNEKINVRHMLLEILSGSDIDEPEKTVAVLEDLVAQTKDSLSDLKMLNEALVDLKTELRETGEALR